MDLLILAGGMGSRYGGLKQIEEVDEYGNFIIDYSIFDAIRCGYDRVVFIINEDNFEIFKSTIGKRIENKIDVEYVFQTTNNIPKKFKIPISRSKPFGTAHAILCAKNKIKGDFVVINADDFYGFNSLKKASEFLTQSISQNEYALVGYKLENTVLDGSKVKRGVCEAEEASLKRILECEIDQNGNKYSARRIDNFICENDRSIEVSKDTLVSMNLFAFHSNVFKFLQAFFEKFLFENKDDLSSCEFYITTFLSEVIQKKLATVTILPTTSKWIGMTYRQDKKIVTSELKELTKQRIYPENLWNN